MTDDFSPTPRFVTIEKRIGWDCMCEQCGASFFSRRSDARMCGEACRCAKYREGDKYKKVLQRLKQRRRKKAKDARKKARDAR